MLDLFGGGGDMELARRGQKEDFSHVVLLYEMIFSMPHTPDCEILFYRRYSDFCEDSGKKGAEGKLRGIS